MGIAIFIALIPIIIAIIYFITDGFKVSGLILAIGMSAGFLFVAVVCIATLNMSAIKPEEVYAHQTEVAEYNVYSLDEVVYWQEKNSEYVMIDKEDVPTKVNLSSITHSNEIDAPVVKEFEYKTLSKWYYYIYMYYY